MTTRGIRRDKYGLRAYVKVGKEQREKRYPAETPIKTIQAWRDETRVSLRANRIDPQQAGTLASDIPKYLEQVAAMPTYAQRAEHLQLWADALGANTPRRLITKDHIRAVLQAWRQAGLSEATCNKRRTALMHLWSVLDGKDARNPVRAVRKFRVPDALPRGRDPHTVDEALKKAKRCRSRACCRVLLWTGLRPDELQRADPDDLDRQHRTLFVRTGKGGRTRSVPLTSQALAAFTEFEDEECWGRVPQAAPLGRWLKQHTGLETLRVYDLRHSYGTALARRGTRLDVIGSLMGHSTLELTRRYTLAAVTPDAAEATQKLARKAGRPKRAHDYRRKSA